MSDLEAAQETLRKVQAQLVAANREKFVDLCKSVREKITVATSPRSATGDRFGQGYTEITDVSVDRRGLIVSATERVKDRGVNIDLVIPREIIPDIVAMMLRWPVE